MSFPRSGIVPPGRRDIKAHLWSQSAFRPDFGFRSSPVLADSRGRAWPCRERAWPCRRTPSRPGVCRKNPEWLGCNAHVPGAHCRMLTTPTFGTLQVFFLGLGAGPPSHQPPFWVSLNSAGIYGAPATGRYCITCSGFGREPERPRDWQRAWRGSRPHKEATPVPSSSPSFGKSGTLRHEGGPSLSGP